VFDAADFAGITPRPHLYRWAEPMMDLVARNVRFGSDTGGKRLTDADYRVEKMRYGKRGKEKDLTTLHYHNHITLAGIPLEAYDYVVNGKPALGWVVERQCVKTDRASGIVNDANDWSIETMGNPRYPRSCSSA
jgi:predicted helicase